MYCDYWGLRERPFQNVTDPKFFYTSHQHEEAVSRFIWAVRERQGVLVLSGEYGCGKTLVSRVVIQELTGDSSCQLVLIVNPRLSVLEFLKTVVYELGGYANSILKVDVLKELKQILGNNYKANRATSLVIDDAQAIQEDDVFEEIRLLLNFQQDNVPLLNIVLLGQPELKERISRIRQLEQRVALWFHLVPFSEEETAGYIRHRMKITGQTAEIFTPDALRMVHGFSNGIPRLINNVCNMALTLGWSSKANRMDETIVRDAWQGIKGSV